MGTMQGLSSRKASTSSQPVGQAWKTPPDAFVPCIFAASAHWQAPAHIHLLLLLACGGQRIPQHLLSIKVRQSFLQAAGARTQQQRRVRTVGEAPKPA